LGETAKKGRKSRLFGAVTAFHPAPGRAKRTVYGVYCEKGAGSRRGSRVRLRGKNQNSLDQAETLQQERGARRVG